MTRCCDHYKHTMRGRRTRHTRHHDTSQHWNRSSDAWMTSNRHDNYMHGTRSHSPHIHVSDMPVLYIVCCAPRVCTMHSCCVTSGSMRTAQHVCCLCSVRLLATPPHMSRCDARLDHAARMAPERMCMCICLLALSCPSCECRASVALALLAPAPAPAPPSLPLLLLLPPTAACEHNTPSTHHVRPRHITSHHISSHHIAAQHSITSQRPATRHVPSTLQRATIVFAFICIGVVAVCVVCVCVCVCACDCVCVC